jgi:amino acid adenylation domain-containing protein
MTLLAAFQTLLYRYSGQEDIIVGTPIANRNRVETEGLIGFFVNTLALRSDLSGNPAFAELLGRVKEAALGAFAHQDLPFEMLVEALQPERDTSHSPVFQVMFALQNAPAEMGSLKDVTVTPLNDQGTVAKFDLTLHIEEKSDAISGSFEYNTDLFDAATISRMSEHLQTLLQGIVADPGNRVSDLPVLTGSERRRLLQEWNDTVRDYPKDKCIHELFEDQAEKTPDAVAAVFDDGQLTYRELNRRSNQLARYLRKLGVGPEVLVGICAERSVEMVAGLLGILKAGGAYVPLDPAYPRERLSFMLEDTRCPVILAQQRLVAGLPDHEATLVRLDADWEKISRENEENPASEVKDGHIAYVMYTSGSTGRPKGICVPHRAIKRLVCNTDYVSLEPSDRVAQAANASFDAATFEIWGALVNGATLVGIAKETALSPQEFAAHIRERRISTLFLTTALFNQMAREAPGAFRSVRHLLFGGEAVDAGWVRDVIQNSPPKRLLHVYGPTESTTFTSWHLVTDAAQESATVPIGRPIAATQTYVLDRTLEPVPIGVPGELHIGGDGLARAYLNRPELTAEKFIPDPFSHEPGSRLYKTGDLVRYQPDGALEFLGRIDHQVKIRGFRIELGEIETTLADHPAVKEAAVIAREDTAGDKRLTAYVVFEGEPGPASAELRAFLKERLPDYMVPSAFVFLEMLPLTANGKVDRKALPAPDQNRPEQEESYVAPRTPAEVMLANIWTEILGVKQAGVHDNFFNLGGHSLLATQVVSRMREVFQAEVPLRSFFEAPTIAALAQLVEDVKSREGESQLPVLGRVSREKYSGNVSPDGAIEISEGLMDEIMNSKKIRSKR